MNIPLFSDEDVAIQRLQKNIKFSDELVNFALGDKYVLLTKKEASNILFSFYDLVWISNNVASIDDATELIDYNIGVFRELGLLDKIEEFYHILSGSPKLGDELESKRKEIVDRILERKSQAEKRLSQGIELPKHSMYAIELDKIVDFQSKLFKITSKLKELGHKDIADSIDNEVEGLLLPNMPLEFTGLDFEVTTDSGELIGKGSLDETKLRNYGNINMEYYLGENKDKNVEMV